MNWFGKDDQFIPAEDSGLRRCAPAESFQRAAKAPPRRRFRHLVYGSRPEPPPPYPAPVAAPGKGRVGICCSGGGIRSAAFSLGALQRLQQQGELRRASYLTAVSGGSYIAAAISMVNTTGRGGSDPELLKRKPPFAPGSPEEQYLRNRCSYLAPTLPDKISVCLRLALGLIMNLIYLAIPLTGVALLLVAVFYGPLLPGLTGPCAAPGPGRECSAELPAAFPLVPLAAFSAGIALALAAVLLRRPPPALERLGAVWSARLLIIAGSSAMLLVATPLLIEVIRTARGSGGGADVAFGGISSPALGAGTVALLAGVLTQIGHLLRSKEGMEQLPFVRRVFAGLGTAARVAVTYAAGALIGPLLLYGIFLLATSAGMAEARTDGQVDIALLLVAAAVLAVFCIAYWFTDVTSLSLHPYYKARLSSVFALKRVREAGLSREERERTEARVAEDPNTDSGIAIERGPEDPVAISAAALQGGAEAAWPTLIVCAAANISDRGATPPGRRVTSFTFSAGSVGGPLVGAVRTWEMECGFQAAREVFPRDPGARDPAPDGPDGEQPLRDRVEEKTLSRRRGDLSLPALIAISGAAISPSMGKMTRPPLRFLMALANIRLGVWLPNPRWIGAYERNSSLRMRHMRPRLAYLLFELFGLNEINRKYLYVTDGGHYENLGLVELLRRGCTEIYCLDASGVGQDGGEFEALGEAIALARSEVGVEVEFDSTNPESAPETMVPGEDRLAQRDVITGRIVYTDANGRPGVEGRIVYVRNAMTKAARWDVRAYHQSDSRFPNNPTIDQLYTDQKFEAYRALGAGAGERAVAAMAEVT